MQTEIAARAVDALASTPTLIVGPFLLLPDELERRRAYRSLGVQADDMRALDRVVVRRLVLDAKGDRFAIGPFCR